MTRCHSSLCCPWPKSRAPTGKYGKDHPTCRVDHPEERTVRLPAALQWPSLRWRRAIASLTLFHRLKNSPTPVASSRLPAPFASDNSRSRRRQHQVRQPTTRSTRYTRSFFLPLSSSLEHASKLHSVALIHILFLTCIRGTLACIQIPYRHRHLSPTCLVRMAPTITDGSSSVSSYIINYPAQHTMI